MASSHSGSGELRVFFARSKGAGTIWRTFDKPASVERRSDVYIHLAPDVGIKWRGRHRCEVKLRCGVDAATRVEYWSKRGMGACPQPDFGNDALVLDSVEQALTALLRGGLDGDGERRAVEAALGQIGAIRLAGESLRGRVFLLDKARRSTWLREHGVSVEQAHVVVSAPGKGGDWPRRAYRSIAVEGSDDSATLAAAMRVVLAAAAVDDGAVMVEGYPGFLARLHAGTSK